MLEPYVFNTAGRPPEITQITVEDNVRVRGTRRTSHITERNICTVVDDDNRVTLLRRGMDTTVLSEYAIYYITKTKRYGDSNTKKQKTYYVIVRDPVGQLYATRYYNIHNNKPLAMDLMEEVKKRKLTGYEALSMLFI